LSSAARLACAGCGLPAGGPYPFRCAGADGDDVDHLVTTILDMERLRFPDPYAGSPFIRFRKLTHAYHLAMASGLCDGEYVTLVERLETRIARVDGRGFTETPFACHARLAAHFELGSEAMWVKNETVNVSGTHKARHLAAIALHLEVTERAGLSSRAENDRRGLAIASCGNAALAAAVLARATDRPLRVFIPTDADAAVVARLGELGAAIEVCPRTPGVAGDPTVHAFRDAVAAGAIPFCCQGSENGLNIEGGKTLGWEIASAFAGRGTLPERLFVQVGGGALASALVQGLREAVALGVLPRMPRVHAVQTSAVAPLRRAYERVRSRILGGDTRSASANGDLHTAAGSGADETAARRMIDPGLRDAVHDALDHARTHRSGYMWPWEQPQPSAAHAMLDDETYDWRAIVAATIESGGYPVVVSEARLTEATTGAREATGIPVTATGSAGLAGLLTLRAAGVIPETESAILLFTGADRAASAPH